MPRAATGLVESPEPLEPQFVDLPLPTRHHGVRFSQHRAAIESLAVGGKAYVVPLNGESAKIVCARVGYTARKIAKERSWKVAVRIAKLGVEPVVGVWRLK